MKAPPIDLSLTPSNLGKIVAMRLRSYSGHDARFFNDLVRLCPVISRLGRCFQWFTAAFELRFFNCVFTLGNADRNPKRVLGPARAASDPAAAAALVDMGNQVREYVLQLAIASRNNAPQTCSDYEGWLIEAMSHGDYDAFCED